MFKAKYRGGLGFRDIRSFNMAMLAKQIWRLHKEPNTLLAKVLKAKYYPQQDVLKANLGHNPSFSWRSMHQAQWVIKKGGCWKIGNGNNVNIWEDN